MNFKEELNQYSELVNNELIKYIRKDDCPEKILNESMEYSLMAGGKRLRPILILKTYQLFKENIEECLPFAIAMEMVHTFSLIHDDLPGIDNDDLRRGKLTNHKKYNEATAILAGDSLLNYAYNILLKEVIDKPNERKLLALKEFSDGIDRMIVGEYVDTEFEGKEISQNYLEYMHKNKTGALIRACVRIGAIIAGAKNEDIEKLTSYADKIGLAFQVKDDILSETGTEEELGKPIGNDKAIGKCTYVTKYGIEQAKNMLDDLTKEAVNIIEEYENSSFLKELAIYIANRNK